MVRWVVAISLKYRYLVVFAAMMLLIFGLIQLHSVLANFTP